jgi:hypothetical protein
MRDRQKLLGKLIAVRLLGKVSVKLCDPLIERAIQRSRISMMSRLIPGSP